MYRIVSVRLEDVRIHESFVLKPADGVTLLRGPNGSGKTSVLEAITLGLTLRPLHGGRAGDLVRRNAPRARITLELEADTLRSRVVVDLWPAGRLQAWIDGRKVKSSGEFVERFAVTTFVPDDLALVAGAPDGRRRFMDAVMVQMWPALTETRRRFERALRQRNSLLRQARAGIGRELIQELRVWEERLAAEAHRLAEARAELVAELSAPVTEEYRSIAGHDVAVGLTYSPDWVREGLRSRLESVRAEEIARGATLYGPHRDDLEVTIAGLPARTHASQGERRTLALAMKIAAHVSVAARRGSAPVLLLDDVFSELDEARSERLLRALPRGQTILTSAGSVPEGWDPESVVELSGPTSTRGSEEPLVAALP
ncbi:MAG: DNA replication and repair protein RecF [Acidimicrobiales bacterium]|nr:MAG: DNA replication and repair protein RecF [Acidimicrobiales bacterium]